MTSTETTPIGLAFSGGGIRSAAFCSGVLRRLLKRKVKIDYLSCVSGGGYTGTAFLDWKYRKENGEGEQHKDSGEWHRRFFRHMRKRAGYFCNWEKPREGIRDTAIRGVSSSTGQHYRANCHVGIVRMACSLYHRPSVWAVPAKEVGL